MKLWKRRPLSEDLTRKDLLIPDEMPPALVYISPGNQRISKRSSITKENVVNLQFSCDRNSFHGIENKINMDIKTISKNYHFQSFKDFNDIDTVKFDENTLKSLIISNNSCKSYLPPVSSEWSPVKDVMKICRSASVPFHSRNTSTFDVQESKLIQSKNTKSPNISLSEKIKMFFRNRSVSRSSKNVLSSITESKLPKSSNIQDKGLNRISRSRKKEIERCNSLYETTSILDNEEMKKSNHNHSNNNSLSNSSFNKPSPCQMSKKKIMQITKKGKLDKKTSGFIDNNNKKIKTESINSNLPQRGAFRGFSSSVVSHTTSSAAKCKSNSPNTNEINHSYLRNNKNLTRNITANTGENFAIKSSTIFNFPDFDKIESSVFHKPPQAMITPKYDKKLINSHKSDVLVMGSARFDSEGCKQKSVNVLPNKIISTMKNNLENRAVINDQKYITAEYDYVTLAEVNISLPMNRAFMTQSLYVSTLPECTNIKPNNDIRVQNQLRQNNQQKDTVYQISEKQKIAFGGEIRKRPISCMAVVNGDNRIPTSCLDNTIKNGNNYPKSPYLSQYSKLYSLRNNDMDSINKYGNEMVDIDFMTRSQHSGNYRIPLTISKDHTGKLSIDSGLVDDINAFHQDCV